MQWVEAYYEDASAFSRDFFEIFITFVNDSMEIEEISCESTTA